MKKIISIFLSLCIIMGCIPVVAASAQTQEKETPKFRIGVISDMQCNTVNDDGMKFAVKAFEKFKELGVDVVVNAGDIADSNAEKIYPYYLQQFNDILPGCPHVSVPGNHDVWRGDHYATYKYYFGEPNNHVVIGGYHFITIASETDLGSATNGNYGTKSKKYASDELEAAAKDANGEPIFVITHQHITDTVYISESWGNAFLHGIIENYPNAIHLSGHSHAPLDDERSIWQGDFTAINTCCLSYTELEYGKDNGSVPPNSGDCKEYLYLEIFDNRIDVSRIKAQTGELIKTKWVLDLPLSKSTFKYTDARADLRSAPYFERGTKITTTIAGKDVTFSFPAAKHEDFVHSYRIKVTKAGDTQPIKDILIFSDFYRGLKNMAENVSYTIKGFAEELTFYTVEIYPIESFGKVGEPIVKEFSSIDDTQLPKLSRGNVFTVDFVNGTPRNATGNAELKATDVEIQKVNDKWAYIANGKGKLAVLMSNSYFTITSKKFSMEAVFSVNDFKTVQSVMSCYKKGGTEMYVDTDGKVKVKVYTKNGDVGLSAPIKAGEFQDVMVTYNSTAKQLILYVNGEKKDSCELTGSISYNLNVGYEIGNNPEKDSPFNGIIYTACLSSSAKTESEVLDLYNTKDNGYNLEILAPVMEEAQRMELIKQKNPTNASINTLANNYLEELHAILDSYYFLPKDAQSIKRADINSWLEKMSANGLNDTYERPVISGVVNGERYDLLEAAPAATWDVGTATLNGEPYTAGTPIEDKAENTLLVWNGDKLAYAQFETYVSYVAPVISGIEDGGEYDLYKEDAPSITWTPAELEGKLDSVTYTAGTPVTELGWHTFMVADGNTTLVYAFKIVDTTPTVSGIENGKEYDLYKEEIPSITWTPTELEGKLDDAVYTAGTPITEIGSHTFVLSDEKTTLTYTFTIVDNTPVPVITGIENGQEFDLHDVDAPSATWDVGTATLDGEPYTAGTPIEAVGAHTLTVVNGSKTTTVEFTVKNTSTVPEVEGVEEGAELDLAAGKAVLTWNVGTATLNGNPIESGYEITEPGEYKLVIKDGTETKEINFTVVDTTPQYMKGDFDDDKEITVADALAALRIAAKLVPEDDTSILIGDVDNDQHVTVADALAILRVAAKLTDTL